MSKIFIDPGHGGKDSGAYANGIKEKDINLIVALRVRDILQAKGHTVFMSRETDVTVDLNYRAVLERKANVDYFCSIHHNAGGGTGYEVIHSIYKGKGQELAYKIAEEFDKIPQKKHRVYSRQGSNGKDYYCVIRETKAPAVITEFCFIDTDDYHSIDTHEKLMREALAIANGILRQVGDTTYTEPKPEQKSDVLYRVQVGAYSVKSNAENMLKKLKENGFDGFIVEVKR